MNRDFIYQLVDLRGHNKALLPKSLWRYGSEPFSLWCKVVVSRCGEILKWATREVRGRHSCGIWKSIMMGKEFWKFIRFRHGLESNIRFSEDLWIGEVILKERIRNIYGLVIDLHVSVVDSFDNRESMWL